MDTINAQCAIFIDLFDCVFDAGFLKVFFLLSSSSVKWLFIKRIRENPVFGNQFAQSTWHYTCVTGKCHIDCCSLIQNRHDTYINRHCYASFVDFILPAFELFHIPAKLCHDIISAVILFLFQNSNVCIQTAAWNMTFRRSSNSDFNLVAKLFANVSYQISGIFEISACSCPTKRKISTQSQHMVNTIIQIILKLFFDSFTSITDTGKVSYRYSPCILDHLTNIHVLSYVCTAGTIGTGNILRFKFTQFCNCSRKVFHSFVCLWWEKLKREELFLFHHFW